MDIKPPQSSRFPTTWTNPVDLIVSESSTRGTKLHTVGTFLGTQAATAASFDDALRAARELATSASTAMAVLSAKDGAFSITPVWRPESRVVGMSRHLLLEDSSRKTLFGREITFRTEAAFKQLDTLQALVDSTRYADLRSTNVAPFVKFDS
jgi:hypothetical protein